MSAVCQFPLERYSFQTLLNRTGIWLPVASFQFTRMCELVPGCYLRISYLPKVVLNHLKSNWHLTLSCQLPFHKNVQICISLLFADFPVSLHCLKSSEIELASCCQLPIHKNEPIDIWLPLAGFLITLNRLKSSEIEWHLPGSCQLPIHNS